MAAGATSPGGAWLQSDNLRSFNFGTWANRIDLGGWTLLPGLCDAHLHLFHEARRRLRVDLAGLARRAETVSERLLVELAASPGAVIHADPDRLREIIAALLDNAIRYTPAGGEVGLRVDTLDSGTVELRVHAGLRATA